MANYNDTEPNMQRVALPQEDGVAAPPKILLWGMIGLFVLIIVGAIAGVFIFRDVLRPSQQQRVIEQVPFMRAFLQPTPAGGTLPTVVPNATESTSAMDLLNMPLVLASPTVAEVTVEPTLPVVLEASATPLPTATATLVPTEIVPTAVLTATQVSQANSATVSNTLPIGERIVGFSHQQQTWNNCGPATITMALSYFGWTRDQEYAKNLLRPNREDKNVSPEELVNFVNTQTQVKAFVRIGGNLNVLKALIANRFPVVIERGIMFEGYDWVGHYQLLVAYDDNLGQFYAFDSFLGTGAAEQGVAVPYQQFDEDWRSFNRTFIVVYNPADEGLLKTVLGDLYDEQNAAKIAFEVAQAEANARPQDGFSWFNMGTALTKLARYQEASNAFDFARRFELPWRMLWYQYEPFLAYFEVGRYADLLSLADINLNNAEELEETYYWRGRVYQAQGDSAKAQNEYQRALGYNPNYSAAQQALNTLN